MINATEASSGEQVLADFEIAIEDKKALLRDPESHVASLTEQIKLAAENGLITAEDLREHLEWADAALSWALEERLNAT
ncbi:hypothetical protein F2S72_01295 [Pseudomonas syringae pv. actinidiae]|nr:hypothetical protein [Pseudomonas syringae pv. actinidiae]